MLLSYYNYLSMEYKIYTVQTEEKLSSIAERYHTTPEDIKALNPNARFFKAIFGSTYIACNQKIKIPIAKKKVIQPQESYIDILLNNFVFTSKARYRCEQINTTKINNTLTSYVNQKTQYVLAQNLEEKYARTVLEEFLYEVVPPALADSFELVKATEFIKNNAYFQLSEKGKIEKLLNSVAIARQWKVFKEKDFAKLPFIASLQDKESVKSIEQLGNKQFNNPNIQEYQRTLFHFLCFDSYLYQPVENLEKEEFLYTSTLLPPLVIPLEFRYDKVSENKNILTLRKVAEVKLSEKLMQELTAKYNETLKPAIKFNFTEYKLFFSCLVEFDTETKLLEKGTIKLKEEIADNVENTCDFNLTRLHNYIP